MDEKLKGLWKDNKIFFFLLLPLILIVVFKDLIYAYLVGSARKVFNNTKAKDETLKDEFTSLNNEANQLKKEANEPKDTTAKKGWHLDD